MDPNAGDQTDVQSVAEETSSPDVTESGSSSEPAAEEKTFEDAIRESFLEDDEAEAEGNSDPEEPEGEEAEGEEGQKSDDDAAHEPEDDNQDESDDFIPEAEFEKLSKGVKKRIGMLSKQVKTLEAEKASYQKSHEYVQSVEQFVTENQIEPQNITRAYGLMAQLSKGDFKGFLDGLKPFIDYARQNLGEVLPKDLEDAVEEGQMTEEWAQQIAQTRAQQARQQEQDQRRQQTDQQSDQIAQITRAIDAREAELKSDPDYAALAPQVQEIMGTMMSSGARPQSPDEAVTLLNKAVELAKRATPPRPKPRPTPPAPEGQTPSPKRSQPKTMEEAISAAWDTLPG